MLHCTVDVMDRDMAHYSMRAYVWNLATPTPSPYSSFHSSSSSLSFQSVVLCLAGTWSKVGVVCVWVWVDGGGHYPLIDGCSQERGTSPAYKWAWSGRGMGVVRGWIISQPLYACMGVPKCSTCSSLILA